MRPERWPGEPLIERLTIQERDEVQACYVRQWNGARRRRLFDERQQEGQFDPRIVNRFNRYNGTHWVDLIVTSRLLVGPLQAPALPKRPKKPPTVQIEDAPLPRLVSINRACELIGMTRHTLYNWDGSGDCAARIR